MIETVVGARAAPGGGMPPGGANSPEPPGRSGVGAVNLRRGLDSGVEVAHTVWMGIVDAVVGFRHGVDRAGGADFADDELVARVRAGDDAAFEHIYDRYARGMLAFCLHMVGNRDTAEDALQLTFVSAYRALRTSEDDIALRPWLYTIARNRCLSELRARRDLVAVDDITVDQQSPEGVADQVQRREDLRELVHDMQRLPVDQRTALVLFELGDHSHKDIAAVLGVRTPKVKALIFQAREGLVRGRQARERPCAEIRERLATSRGTVLPRSLTRAHIDRCPSCAAFEYEVRRQRAALALILPVPLAGELKAWVLGSALHTGGTVAAGAGACAGGAVATGAYACAGGTVVAGGASSAGAASGAVAVAAVSTTGIAGAGTGAVSAAVAAAVPMGAAATGLTAVGEYAASVGAAGLGGAGVVAKVLTAAVIAAGVAGVNHPRTLIPGLTPPAALRQILTASARPAAPAPIAKSAPAALPASPPPVAKPTSVNGVGPVAPAASGTADPADPTAPDSGTAGASSGPGPVTQGTSSSAAASVESPAAPAAPAAPASAPGESGGEDATSSTGGAGASVSSGTAGATTVTGSTDTAGAAQTTSSTDASGTADSTDSTDASETADSTESTDASGTPNSAESTDATDPSDTAGSSTPTAPADASDSSGTATSPSATPADDSDQSDATDDSASSGTTTSSTSAPATTDLATDPTTTLTTDDATASPTTDG